MIKTPLSTVIGGAFWTPGATIIGGTSKTINQLIKSLFSNGEQGFAYDPNDLTTMFQDAAGTIPVTAAGQPVGLVLDKSKGLALGAERAINGDVSQGLTNWDTITADTTLSVVAGKVRATLIGANNPRASLLVNNLVIGKVYKVSIQIAVGSLATPQVIVRVSTGVGLTPIVATATVNSAQEVTFLFRATATQMYFGAVAVTATIGEYFEVSGASVKEVLGSHAYQTVSASRPVLQRNATTGAYYLAFDGVDDFLVTSSIDFTMTDKVSLFAGVRKLQDGSYGTILEHGVNTDSDGSFALMGASGNGYYMQCGGIGNRTLVVSSGGGGAPRIDVVAVQMDRSKTDVSELKYAINTNTLASNAVEIESSGATGNFINLPLYIGRRAGTSLPFSGHLYSLISIGRLTTDNETVALEKSIARNTGAVLNV